MKLIAQEVDEAEARRRWGSMTRGPEDSHSTVRTNVINPRKELIGNKDDTDTGPRLVLYLLCQRQEMWGGLIRI